MGLTLPITDFVQVNVNAAPASVAPKPFNQGLIIGPSAVIPSIGANARLRQYASVAGMTTDGFTGSEPEEIAATIYFSQSPPPAFVWIGRQDLTAIQTLTVAAGRHELQSRRHHHRRPGRRVRRPRHGHSREVRRSDSRRSQYHWQPRNRLCDGDAP